MATLVDTHSVNTFKQSYFFKGFSAMLVAVSHVGNFFLWHHLFRPLGDRISYLEANKIPKELTTSTTSVLEQTRHIIGWCSVSTYHAGSREADYQIEHSRLPQPHPGCILEKCSIAGGQFITAGTSVALGLRDRPVRITRLGYLRKMKWILKKYVILWDEGEKRGWLVTARAPSCT